jgi:hypothetical protein
MVAAQAISNLRDVMVAVLETMMAARANHRSSAKISAEHDAVMSAGATTACLAIPSLPQRGLTGLLKTEAIGTVAMRLGLRGVTDPLIHEIASVSLWSSGDPPTKKAALASGFLSL